VKLEFSLILVDQTTRFVRSVLRNWGFQMEIFLLFLLSKTFFFSFFILKEKKRGKKKVRKEEKEKKEKAYTSQICFLLVVRKITFLVVIYCIHLSHCG